VQPHIYKLSQTPEGEAKSAQEIVLHPDYIDDLALWKSFIGGDEKALITIYDRFSGPMFNYGYKLAGDRELVKDSIQELFIEIWQSRSRLGETDSIKLYLYKSLRRKLARIKAKAENRLVARLLPDYCVEISPSPEFILINQQISEEKNAKLRTMLNTLTRRQQEVIFLRYFEELTCDQIAQVMNLSKQAVYNLIHHAIAQLRSVKNLAS
jgi:RNA polymerase sigma factor (sigma-70 family)